jgi:hypothetical protein
VSQRERCLKRIDEVREAAHDLASAYLIRTRLQRMLIALGRLLADYLALEVRAPSLISVPNEAPIHVKELASLYNSVFLEGQHLVQRSEALDVRWQEGWARLSAMLDRLEAALVSGGRGRSN